MRLEYNSEKKLKKNILDIAKKYLDLKDYRLFFFGSRVIGKGDDRSDIDLGIESKNSRQIPTSVKLDMEEELENLSTLYSIDMVDFNRVGDDFNKIAKQKIEYLN